MAQIIGRENEQVILTSLLYSEKSEFLAVYGRRRVGKTYLITQFFKDKFAFKHTGVSPFDEKGTITMKDQLQAFYYSLLKSGMDEKIPCPKSWQEAFFQLGNLLEKKATRNKKVVFIDELPWMDTPRSKFVSAFEWFYNGWASHRDDILLVICGSSSSWVLNNIVNAKGGLYNRLTCSIKLKPFNLKETEDYLHSKKILLERYDIVRLYMALGGIPYYLDFLQKGLSVEQNIDNILFAENAPLNREFVRLFNTLFSHSENYIAIVKALSKRNYGFTRSELSEEINIKSGGGLSDYLDKLKEADFIEQYKPVMSLDREDYFRLKDCFCIFYLRYIYGKSSLDPHFWQNSSGTQGIKSWEGVAFEQICMSHLENIRIALGISGVVTKASNMIIPSEDNKRGAQIDMVIDRADKNVNICEMKFYSSEFLLSKEESLKLRDRMARFREKTPSRKNLFLTLITTFGLKHNQYSGIFNKVITLDHLFQQ